uniref:mRNA export factor GLE1 n=1 Tax=Rhodosorus marinus TaxID=101924 RepID=A0A7S3EE64_9RHOD|mmetsp:Transcript_29038/g.112921  ORF Transcript_29038/g.112921 Transcript_29038/m.112921 type:complete len:163 (+) Transcript_29038:74-562(+)
MSDVMPFQVHRLKGQTEEEYRMAIGYLEGETTDQYYERMVGYLSLYSAIMQTDLRAFGIQNPIGIEKAWTWIAKTVNSKTRRITATLLITFLEICGYEMHRTYRLQFSKLVKLICNQLIPTFPRDSPPGPTTRIVVFGEEYARGQLDPPKGKQLPQRDLEYT